VGDLKPDIKIPLLFWFYMEKAIRISSDLFRGSKGILPDIVIIGIIPDLYRRFCKWPSRFAMQHEIIRLVTYITDIRYMKILRSKW
jgi:hypothetical protein